MKIIAVGNSLYGDDGIGEAILSALCEIAELTDVELINGATDALGLIDHFDKDQHVVIIDAASMGSQPGTIKVFDSSIVEKMINSDHISLHGISLAETFEIARIADCFPEQLTIVGIEPEQLKIAAGLSKSVTSAIPQAVSKILELFHLQTV